ncbi:MAG: putative Ig domain-containing protein [Betaproteobacteria bacterium]|nr:putative Ig domain-containing protein [Betaproteobacteria bacterium]
MSFADVLNRTRVLTEQTQVSIGATTVTMNGFANPDDVATIIAALRTLYVGSPAAKAMLEDWIKPNPDNGFPGNTIFIGSGNQGNRAWVATGVVEIELNSVAFYIDNNGTAVKTALATTLAHELVHALMGKFDDGTGAGLHDRGSLTDYKGATVIEANKIYKELGYPERNAYISQNGDFLTEGKQYTNGAEIDRSVVISAAYDPGTTTLAEGWNSSAAGDSRDLLIGDNAPNTLTAGDGNDFLYGGDDTQPGSANNNDILFGGKGSDYLAGGLGNDIYIFLDGDGNDTIFDEDGKGEIRINGEDPLSSFSNFYGVWRIAATNSPINVLHNPATGLVISYTGGTINVQGWTAEKNLGITLGNVLNPEPSSPDENVGARYYSSHHDFTFSSNASTTTSVRTGMMDDYIQGINQSEVIWAGGGNDLVMGGLGNDTIYGEGGNDYLMGGPLFGSGDDDDVLIGGDGRDILLGGLGDDIIHAGNYNVTTGYGDHLLPHGAGSEAFSDWVAGGDGNDTVFGSAASDFLQGGGGNDVIIAGAGNNVILGDGDIRQQLSLLSVNANTYHWTYSGGQWNYTILSTRSYMGATIFDWTMSYNTTASEGIDFTDFQLNLGFGRTYASNVRAVANGGNDVIFGGDGNDWIAGQTGDDLIYGGNGNDIIYGDDVEASDSDGNDTIYAGHGKDWVHGGGGNDIIYADDDDGAQDIIYGGSGDDILIGGTGKDILYGGEGNDVLIAGKDGSLLCGDEGNDRLYGGDGDDVLYGDSIVSSSLDGDDVIYAGNGADLVFGGGGNDVIYANDADNAEDQLYGGTGNDTIFGGTGHDLLYGGAGDDVLYAGSDGSFLYGEADNDKLFGGAGNDRLDGGAGDDYIVGSQGRDTIIGGAGADTFDFLSYEYLSGDLRDADDVSTIQDASNEDRLILNGESLETLTWRLDGENHWVAQTSRVDRVGLVDLRMNGANLIIRPAWEVAMSDGSIVPFTSMGSIVVQNFTNGVLGLTLPGLAPPTNNAPTVTGTISAITGQENMALSFILPPDLFTDPDGDVLSLSATLADGSPLPTWLTFDPVTGAFSGTPEAGSAGELTIRLTATDPGGLAASLNVTLGIQPPLPINHAPEVNGTLDAWEGRENLAFAFVLPQDLFTDPDGDVLSLSATLADGSPLPTWLTFDPITGAFSGTPEAGSAGELSIKLTATDPGGLAASLNVTLGIQPPLPINHAPEVTGTLDVWEGRENLAFAFVLPPDLFTDPDGDTLTLSATLADGSPLPTWLVFDPVTGAFSGTPEIGSAGELAIVLTATDPGGLAASLNVTLGIQPPLPINHAPEVTGTLDAWEGRENLAFAFVLPQDLFTDPDGDTLTLSATLADGSPLPTWLTFDPVTGAFSGTPEMGSAGELTIVLTATDPGGFAASLNVTLGIQPPLPINHAPEVTGTLDAWEGRENLAFAFVLPQNLFIDPDGDVLSLSATLADGSPLPTWLTFDPVTGAFSGTPEMGSAGELTIVLTATDPGGLAASLNVTLGIQPPLPINHAPEINDVAADYLGRAGQAFTLVLPASLFIDPDGDELSFTVTLRDGSPLPAWLTFDPATRTLSGTPGTAQIGNLALSVTASDPYGLAASQNFALSVEADNTAIIGTAGNDVLRGTSAADLILGLAGNDSLYGNAGNDTLVGGTGNDHMEGGAGNDTYVFSVGDGQDIITDNSGTNSIRFTDVNVDGITFSRSGNYLVIGYGDSDQILVTNHFSSAAYRMAQIEFADGSTYSMSELLANNPVYLPEGNNNVSFGADNDIVHGGAGNDTIRGGAGNDLIYGGTGNDRLYGDAGNDTLVGGTGNDSLEGGAGNDTYVFSKGDGQDIITDNSGTNSIRFTDVNADGVTFSRSGNYLVIGYGDSDQILVTNHFSSTAYRMAQIEFADGSIHAMADLLAPIPLVAGVTYNLSDFLPQALKGAAFNGLISFTGLNLDEPGAAGDGETFQTAGEILDGLMELSSGFAEDYLPNDGEWVDVTLAGVQLPEEGHFGL